MTIDSTGRWCKCGNYGCLEQYASGTAIARRAREALIADSDSLMHRMVEGDLERLTAALVYEASKQGDMLALEVVQETARFLGAGVANIIELTDAQLALTQAQSTEAQALSDYRVAIANLERSLGRR